MDDEIAILPWSVDCRATNPSYSRIANGVLTIQVRTKTTCIENAAALLSFVYDA